VCRASGRAASIIFYNGQLEARLRAAGERSAGQRALNVIGRAGGIKLPVQKFVAAGKPARITIAATHEDRNAAGAGGAAAAGQGDDDSLHQVVVGAAIQIQGYTPRCLALVVCREKIVEEIPRREIVEAGGWIPLQTDG